MQGTLVTAVLDLAQRQHGAITIAQLRRLGVSAKSQRTAVRHGWLVVDPSGVLITAGTPDTWSRRLHIGLLALDRRAWVSHDAAAQLYRLPMTPADRVEFTLPRAARGLRTTLRVHTTDELEPGDVRTTAGIRATSPARTVVDLARAGCGPARLAASIDDLARRGLGSRAAIEARLSQPLRRGLAA
ncbi:MAG: type IV toxin-antitoxin system AbiEi family antitoxin domain-containing protein [Desertimonas sp.]